MKLSNLEKIREAWRIGWAAVVRFANTECVVVYVEPSCILARCGTGVVNIYDVLEQQDAEIIGYKYAAELAGNEEPRDGQKFKNKKHGGVLEYIQRHVYPEQGGDCGELYTLMSKILYQPYFD